MHILNSKAIGPSAIPHTGALRSKLTQSNCFLGTFALLENTPKLRSYIDNYTVVNDKCTPYTATICTPIRLRANALQLPI